MAAGRENPEIKEVKEFFFKASLKTYAGEMEKSTIIELPKSKVLRCENGDWTYIDTYFTGLPIGGLIPSFGQTVIWYKGYPIWGMQFRGAYPKEVTPFLKRALRVAYERSEFWGGRGFWYFTDKEFRDYIYLNDVDKYDFEDFQGSEKIIDKEGIPQGWHQYSGLLLFR